MSNPDQEFPAVPRSSTSESSPSDDPSGPVTIRQGGVKAVTANEMTIRQGGAVKVNAGTFNLVQGGVVLANSKSLNLTASEAVVSISSGDVFLDQAAAGAVVAAGGVHIDQGAAGVVVAREVNVHQSRTLLLMAGRVNGEVKTAFGTRDSVIFGALAGAIAGIAILGMALAGKRRED